MVDTKTADQLANNHGYLTICLLTVITLTALVLKDVGMINVSHLKLHVRFLCKVG